MRRWIFLTIPAAALIIAAGAVFYWARPSELAQRIETDRLSVKTESVAAFSHPWGMTMLPSGEILVTERRGRLWRVSADGTRTEIGNLPEIAAVGQGGLLDIAADPQFTDNRRIFFTYAEPGPGGAGTALASAILDGDRLEQVRVLLAMRKTELQQHFGSRIAFGHDGTIFMTTGDRGERNRAQDPFDLAGSVIRLRRDGSVPADNPFSDGRHGAPEIWSTGHRNIQGAVVHPQTGALFTAEHGAQGGDEINAPEAGRNYGWPVISYGREYSGEKIGEGTVKAGMEQPLHYWDPSIAPSGMAFETGGQFPEWSGDLFVGALKDMKVIRLEFAEGKPVPVEVLFESEFGRIRDLDFFADGNLYLLTDEDPGALIRVMPAR